MTERSQNEASAVRPSRTTVPGSVSGTQKTWPKPATGTWGTMTILASSVEAWADRRGTVIDKTGLTGLYDFHMQWAYHPSPNPADPDKQAAPAEPEEESIFTVLEKQLGLRLESGKGPVEVLVIDHAEKPDPN